MKKILITAPYMHREKGKILDMLRDYDFEADWVPVDERLEEEDLLPVIGKYDGILCGDDRITEKVIDSATNLKVIVKWGTGIDSIHKEYAESKGIQVKRTPNAFTDPVADSVLGFMLNHVRNVATNHAVIRSGQWEKPQGYMLREKTIGIIGFGNIGQAVAKRLIPFGPTVFVNDVRALDDDLLTSHKVTHVSRDEIYDTCDIITLQCDLNPTSKYILDKGAFSKMKKTPYIINVSRGPLIKEIDLLDALERNLISGVGVDVFEHEPLPVDSPLRVLDTVTASCHNTNSSPLCWDRIHRNSLDMMSEVLK